MAKRPVYIPLLDNSSYVRTEMVDFTWFSGMARSQKQKSVASLHVEIKKQLQIKNVLEVSSKSEIQLGVSLSAFNLMIENPKSGGCFSVENAFQAAKVFEQGGPYLDLLRVTSMQAKKDERLANSGRLLKFTSNGIDWPLEPKTVFYDWLYLNALKRQPGLVGSVLDFDAFTDIEFNPAKSINCQAYSVALFSSLYRRGELDDVLMSTDNFLEMMQSIPQCNAYENELLQPKLL